MRRKKPLGDLPPGWFCEGQQNLLDEIDPTTATDHEPPQPPPVPPAGWACPICPEHPWQP